MLSADWSVSTSHDPFALQFLWWKRLWNPSIPKVNRKSNLQSTGKKPVGATFIDVLLFLAVRSLSEAPPTGNYGIMLHIESAIVYPWSSLHPALLPTFHDVRYFLQHILTLLKGLSKTSTYVCSESCFWGQSGVNDYTNFWIPQEFVDAAAEAKEFGQSQPVLVIQGATTNSKLSVNNQLCPSFNMHYQFFSCFVYFSQS